MFETIAATRFINEMTATIKEYHTVMGKRVDVKVEKNNAAQEARTNLITAIQNVVESVRFAQQCLDGAETDLVRAYNTVFVEIASALKLMSKGGKKTESAEAV